MAVKNISSSINSGKTIIEIEKLLVKFGAQGILKNYSGQIVTSIAFYIEYKGQRLSFKLPMKMDKARKVIEKAVDEKKLSSKYRNEPFRSEQAERVGWRVIKDWIHSQLSILEIEFADPVELLLPHVYDEQTDKTFFEKIKDDTKLLDLKSGED